MGPEETAGNRSVLDSAGRKIENFHIEQQFKGNYLLQAVIDGKSRKYIIRKGTAEHEEMTKMGIGNVTGERLEKIVMMVLG